MIEYQSVRDKRPLKVHNPANLINRYMAPHSRNMLTVAHPHEPDSVINIRLVAPTLGRDFIPDPSVRGLVHSLVARWLVARKNHRW